MGTLPFDRYAEVYDLLYRDKNYRAEADCVARLLTEDGGQIRSVLEFGSGTGGHGRWLAGHGFEVFGVERSAAMVAVASRAVAAPGPAERGSFGCTPGDFSTVQLPRTFDAVVALFHVLNYQLEDAGLQRTFENAARHLRPGGLFFFDVWHAPAVLAHRPEIRVKRAEDERLRVWRLAEPAVGQDACRVDVRYTVFVEDKATGQLTRFEESHPLRALFPAEIEAWAQPAGFRVETCAEFLTGRPASADTWGVAYRLRKIA